MNRPTSKLIKWRWQTMIDDKDRVWLDGDQSCYFNRLMDLAQPIEDNDAATKKYVDDSTEETVIGTPGCIPVIDSDGIGLRDSTIAPTDFEAAGTTALHILMNGWTKEIQFNAVPPSTSTLTMLVDRTGSIFKGYALKYVIGGITYYGTVTNIVANLLTISGAPLTGNVTDLYYADNSKIIQVDFFVPGTFADAANTALLNSDANLAFRWNQSKAYCVQILHKVKIADTGINQPRVTISINGNVVGTDNANAGLPVSTSWVFTTTGINISNYLIMYGDPIEVITDANGTNDNAENLTVSIICVIP